MHNHEQVKRVVMVLGMARSGTSTICRGLHAIGVDLGDKLLRPDARNPKGFWEDTDVTFKINRGILKMFNHPWIFDGLVEHMRQQDHRGLNDFKNYAVMLVRERLAGNHCWGFKDTNTAVLMPFWHTVLREAGVEDSYVIALRNPLGCAYSNIRHSNLELEGGLLGWLKNMILALDGTQGKKRVVVSYERMLESPQHELLRMRRELGIYGEDTKGIDEFINTFLDKKLHHHVYDDAELANHPAISAVPLCRRVYSLMSRLAADTLSFADDEFFAECQAVKNEFYHLYPLYQYANTVLKHNLQLEREIRTIRKSWPWKFLRPLTWLDDYLRQQRQRGRMHKRLMKAYG